MEDCERDVRQIEMKIEVTIEGARCRSCGASIVIKSQTRGNAEEYLWAFNDFGEIHRSHIGFEVIGTVTSPEKYRGERISLAWSKSK